MIGWAVLTVAALALATGCSGTAKRGKAVEASLTITPSNGASQVKPGAGVAVAAAKGSHLRTVVVSSSGHQVAGQLAADGKTWRSSAPLSTSRTYTVLATGVGVGGKKITARSSFRTLTPRHTFHTSSLEGDNQRYGIGMAIVLNFSRPITNRAAVERALSITASKPVVGAWYWDVGNKTVAFRPKSYWQSGTQVHFTAALNGVEGANGVYGANDIHVGFSIGPSLIADVSTSTHYMKVYYKGRLFGNWPISTGAPGDDTANGHYLTIEKANPVLMSGPGYTNFPVPWSVRFTWSGNYLHDAYWSVGEQGFINVSHGCVNMSPAHAETYYNMELPGDPVIVTGSPVAGTWDDGWTWWFLTWNQLLNGSALHSAVLAGPSGSSFVDASTVEAPQTMGPRGHAVVP
jgi:lipoprotein-anchoring transpeptidase ErfK/SrfK